jgi:hypothetical protein
MSFERAWEGRGRATAKARSSEHAIGPGIRGLQRLDLVSEGGLEPPRPIKGTSTSS